MKMLKVRLVFQLLVLAYVYSNAQSSNFHEITTIHVPPSPLIVNELSEATTQLALNIIKATRKDWHKNLFFSPASISVGFGMLYAGSSGETRIQIKKALHNGKNDFLIYDQIKNLSQTFWTQPTSKSGLNVAIKLYVQEDFNISKDYRDIMETYFHSRVEHVDFVENTELTRAKINEWVYEKTNKTIQNLIEHLDDTEVMILVNAIYFKGAWLNKFDEAETKTDQIFYYAERQRRLVDMMTLKNEHFEYYEEQYFQVLGLPYADERFVFYIFLPVNRYCLSLCEAKLTSTWFYKLISSTERTRMEQVSIPRFSLEHELHMEDILVKMGMTNMLDPLKADFTIISLYKKLFVSGIIHRAIIEVNEMGSEQSGAARPDLDNVNVQQEMPKTFIANHPFLFAVVDRYTWNSLFVGRFVGNDKFD